MNGIFVPTQHSLHQRIRQQNIQSIEDEITTLAGCISAATFRLLELLREFDLCSGWNDGGSKSCAHWLNWKCGIALGAAREKVRVAHALAELPQITRAFREGALSYSKVRAMTRIATSQNEDYLLMIANHGTASHVERAVRSYRRLGRQESLEREQRRHAERALNWYIDDDGCYVIRARLAPEAGARFAQAMSATMDDLFKDGNLEEGNLEEGDAVEQEPIEARRADALERITDGYLSGSEQKSSGGDRYTLHLHTDLDTLKQNGDGAESELEDGPGVSAETSRRMACDCGVVQWRDNTDGSTLDVGRRTRTIPPALRRALKRRDCGCAFPGCTAQHHVDAHHIIHWADGGDTKLSNLVLLCRHHHRLVHEGGFGVSLGSLKGSSNGSSIGSPAVFTDPDGQVISAGPCLPGVPTPSLPIPGLPATRFSGNAFASNIAYWCEGLVIDASTALNKWRGEYMDLGMVMDGLLTRDSSSDIAEDSEGGSGG